MNWYEILTQLKKLLNYLLLLTETMVAIVAFFVRESVDIAKKALKHFYN